MKYKGVERKNRFKQIANHKITPLAKDIFNQKIQIDVDLLDSSPNRNLIEGLNKIKTDIKTILDLEVRLSSDLDNPNSNYETIMLFYSELYHKIDRFLKNKK